MMPLAESRSITKVRMRCPSRTTPQTRLPDYEDYATAIETQVRILHSDNLAMRVIRKLGLDKNPKFTDISKPQTTAQRASDDGASDRLQAGNNADKHISGWVESGDG